MVTISKLCMNSALCLRLVYRCHWLVHVLYLSLLMSSGCEAVEQPAPVTSLQPAADVTPTTSEEMSMWMTIGERHFAITLTNSATARAFIAQLPLTLNMADLNRNEKYARLPEALPTNPVRPRTIRNGDLMLYGADTLVIFYLTFNASYAYTPLGRINDATGLPQALGQGDVQITFSNQPISN